MLEVVSATRFSEGDFWAESALGQSLRRLQFDGRLRPAIRYDNRAGLSDVYNSRIESDESPGALVFIHDDVWLDDYYLVDRVLAGLQEHDVLGVAGNRRRSRRQPAWAFTDDSFTWDDREYLTGSVAHGDYPFGHVSHYGPSPSDCELLDGVLLAARKSSLVKTGVAFDPTFRFHFYDMDFCRSARAAGLRLSTWPICITHRSGGAFGTPEWRTSYEDYLRKWEE